MTTTIRTNHQWHNFVYRHDVPPEVLADNFDWTSEEDDIDGYFCYRGNWYHLSEFERSNVKGWNGQHCDSYFSAILIQVSEDGEQYRVATYIC